MVQSLWAGAGHSCAWLRQEWRAELIPGQPLPPPLPCTSPTVGMEGEVWLKVGAHRGLEGPGMDAKEPAAHRTT